MLDLKSQSKYTKEYIVTFYKRGCRMILLFSLLGVGFGVTNQISQEITVKKFGHKVHVF